MLGPKVFGEWWIHLQGNVEDLADPIVNTLPKHLCSDLANFPVKKKNLRFFQI